jgi:integrase
MTKKKPVRRYPSIRARWFPRANQWRWRARVKRKDAGELVGPWRDTQEEAHADVIDIRAKVGQGLGVVSTLAEAARALRARKASHGLSERSLQQLDAQEKVLTRYWRPEMPLSAITADEVAWFAGQAQSDEDRPRSPNSILQKDLPYLKRLLRVAGLPEAPVDQARDQMRQHLKVQPPRMEWFEPDEVRRIIDRMRNEVFKDRRGRVLDIPSREWHADIVTVFATTGIRSGEISRLRPQDVDLKRRVLRIVSKDRGHPRDAQVLDVAVPALERLVERAGKRTGEDGLFLVPGGERFLSLMFGRWKKRLNEPRLSGRTLRHSFGSFVFHMAENPAEARAVLGHRSMATTQRYLHELGLHEKKSLSRIESWWSGEADATSPAAGDEQSQPRQSDADAARDDY